MRSSSKHILIVSQYFYPESFRINDMAQEFINRGFKVTVLTGIPNYPTGKYFKGYSRTEKREEIWNKIKIIRLPIKPRGKTPFGLVLNYYSFVRLGKRWAKKNNIGADLVFSYEVSPMTQVKVGCEYSKRNNIPHFLYVQDLWPENVQEITKINNKLIIGKIDKMVDKIYSNTDQIFATSPSFVKSITERKNRVPKEKVHYWPQYAEDFYKPIQNNKVNIIPKDDTLKIAFTGNIGYAQGLQILPETAKLLKDKKIIFVIVGDGRYKKELIQKIKELEVENKFILIPRVEAEKIPTILSACDAGFISFNNSPLWSKTIPAKLQSYMACGKAIIASASGETKRIIEEANCGTCAPIGNPKELAKAISNINKTNCEKWGKNSLSYFKQNFDKTMLMNIMIVNINNAIANKKGINK